MSIVSLIGNAFGLWRPRDTPVGMPVSQFPNVAGAPPDTRRLIRDRRYCHVLASEDDLRFDEVSLQFAWQALQYDMAMVPTGGVDLISDTAMSNQHGFELSDKWRDPVEVETFYIDRWSVTNEDFARFVTAGGYDDPQFWPEDILADLLQFTDTTGKSGPKFWVNGQPPREKADHPVTGICWYEANAYAMWAGKRLPSGAQWQRAGTWSKCQTSTGSEIRYPWGNAFDPAKANTWATGENDTVSVNAFSSGNTPNGVCQLIGNVWEWVDAEFLPHAVEGISVLLDQPMGEMRGGAFDTYFHSQATCQFRSGNPLLSRSGNVGFRCCIDADSLNNTDDFADDASFKSTLNDPATGEQN